MHSTFIDYFGYSCRVQLECALSTLQLDLLKHYPSATTFEATLSNSSLQLEQTKDHWHSCSVHLFDDRFPNAGCSFYL